MFFCQGLAPELSELESVELELGCCCSDLDKQVSDEICRTRKRQFEIPFRLSAASCPRVTSCSISPYRLSRKRRRTDRKYFYHVPQHHKPGHMCEIHFPPNSPFKVARNEVENASFAQRSAHRDSRIWRPELVEPAAERKRRARG